MIPEKDIIKALADNGLRPAAAARAVWLSDKSIRYRIRAIHRRTGLDPVDFWDMRELVNLYEVEQDGNPTALGYMERQLTKHRTNYEREKERGAKPDVLQNIARKISHYEQAVNALRKETA